MDTLNIKVIIGSTREGRFSEKPAQWIFEELKRREGVSAELLDLRDYPLPFFNQAKTPSTMPNGYDIPDAAYQAWRSKIAEADGFIVVTPEYNHGYPAVLKNAIDWVYVDWNKKAIGFVSYGSALGARAIEQLRQVSIELQMAPIRQSIHLPREVYMAVSKMDVPVDPALFAPAEPAVAPFIEQLVWWGKALKAARTA